MSWVQAVSYALVFHLLIFSGFAFTLRGNEAMHKVNLVFFGSILRAQEVLPAINARIDHVESKQVHLHSEQGVLPQTWMKSIAVDKPALFYNTTLKNDDTILRFTGKRVVLDAEIEDLHHEGDIPTPPRIQLRLRRP